jgi:hypothetical protein
MAISWTREIAEFQVADQFIRKLGTRDFQSRCYQMEYLKK